MDERDVNQRFMNFLEERKISQSSIASLLNVTKQRVQQWKTMDKQITLKYLMKFCEAYPELNVRWLMTGEGEMLSKEVSSTIEGNISEPEKKYCSGCGQKIEKINLLESNMRTMEITINTLNNLVEEKQKVINLLEGKISPGVANCG
jgi:transcriptional regulator with XRE-family HTH domain